MTKDEMKNRISMALKDPILQQGFEIICKNLAELEQENNKLLDVINNQDVKIADLEKQIEKMKEEHKQSELGLDISNSSAREELNEKIEVLEQENAELKAELDAIDKAGEHVRQQINDAFRNKKPYWELEKENAELKETIADIEKNFRICESNADTYYDQLTKAKEIIKTFLQLRNGNVLDCCKDKECPCENPLCETINEKAEQFLKEIKK